MLVISAGMVVTATGSYEPRATPSRRETPYYVVLRRESEEKEPGGHSAVPDRANCYAEVADGLLADVWAVKPELGQTKAA